MSFVRLLLGSLFLSALLCIAADGWCAEQNVDQQSIDQQVAERTRQYQESLRQRAAQLSPSLQTKIESQVRQTILKNTTAWKNGEVSLQIALPRLAEVRRIAQFIARHRPGSGSPAGSLEFGIGTVHAALTVTTFQSIVKSLSIPSAHFAISRSLAGCPFRHGGNGISYFVRIIGTIVQRQ